MFSAIHVNCNTSILTSRMNAITLKTVPGSRLLEKDLSNSSNESSSVCHCQLLIFKQFFCYVLTFSALEGEGPFKVLALWLPLRVATSSEVWLTTLSHLWLFYFHSFQEVVLRIRGHHRKRLNTFPPTCFRVHMLC